MSDELKHNQYNEMLRHIITEIKSTRVALAQKNFYEFYALADEKVQRCVALLPWRHNILIISKAQTVDEAPLFHTLRKRECGGKDVSSDKKY